VLNADQVLYAIADLTFCAECHRDLNPETEMCSQCIKCDEWMCGQCSRCACQRTAVLA
jgi:hypothetical protein